MQKLPSSSPVITAGLALRRPDARRPALLRLARLTLPLWLTVGALVQVTPAQQTGTTPPCNNPTPPTQSTGCPPPPEGANPVNVASSDVQRKIRDLEVFGGVGEHQLNWTRVGHSRLADGARWFGDGHIWRHSYQYEMVKNGTNPQITYPDGTVHIYVPNGSNWTPAASNPDLLTGSGSNFYLQRANGFTYHFVKLTSGSGQVSYQLQNFTDSFGNNYLLTYDANGRLTLVTEPAGRWLRITYQDVTVNQDQFTTLYAQASTPPAGWNTVTVSNPTAFRYLRYFSTSPGAQGSYGVVAEIEFYDTAGNKLSGTPFGSNPPYTSSTGFAKAFDGNTGTYFDFQSPHYGFTGIDLGSGNAKAVGKVRFFPRAGYEGRMNGNNPETGVTDCRFEGANVAPVTESVIAKVEAGYGSGANQVITRAVNYNYATFADPALAGSSWLTLTGAAYGDGSAAVYTYQSLYAGQRPLLASADDPRMQGAATKIKYEFWQQNGNVFGAIYAEHDFTSNQILAKFEGDGTAGGRKVTYANGSVHKLVITSNVNTTGYTDAMGNQTSYAYTANGGGFLQSKTDALGHTTSYTRDAQGRMLAITHVDNSAESKTRDALGHVLTHTDARGYKTTWTRDGSGRPTLIAYPDGSYEKFTYNGFGQVLTHRQTNGGTESCAYDGYGRQTGWTDALGHTTTYGYDANDQLVSVSDTLAHATTYARNERGQVTQATYADGTSASYAYDAYGDQLSKTNELGKTWSATYDAYRRRITATDPLGRQTQYWYDEPGAGSCGGCSSGLGGTGSHLTTVILPSGKTTRIGYDAAWQQTSVTSGYNTAAAATMTYAYDAAGNVVSKTDPRGRITTFGYDARNRRTQTTDPLGHVAAHTYDAAGNVSSDTRADGGVTTYVYDAMNRRTQTTDPLSQVTKMAYDAAGNLFTLTDARNNVYGFTYDLLNRKTQMSYPDGSHEDWSYDVASNAAMYTNRAGQVRTMTYDVRNRETDASWNDGVTPEVVTSYDAAGQVLTLNNGNSALSYAYDDAGQLANETQSLSGDSEAKTVAYTYDADGNRAQLTNPDGTQVAYAYTTRNQLSSVSLSGPPPLATYVYDLAGNRVTKSLEDGTAATYAYDDANRLTSLAHQSGGTTLASFAYAYNTVNHRTSVTYASGLGDVYGYDATEQLTGVQYGATNPVSSAPSSPQSTQSYAYDAVGNRTGVTQDGTTSGYAANALNEYTAAGADALSYDANGNLTAGPGGWTYRYDAQNRLIGVHGPASAAGPGLEMQWFYDARNRRVRWLYAPPGGNLAPSTGAYCYEGWNLVAEYGGGGAQTARYVHGAAVDEVLARTDASGSVYYHQDGLGSTAMLTSASGQVVEQYCYSVYGAPTIKNGVGTTIGDSAYGNRFLFTGREWLASLGVYDYRNRAYSPTIGRFIQVDPSGLTGHEFNLYRYAQNNPSNRIDPNGLDDITVTASGPSLSNQDTITGSSGHRIASDLNHVGHEVATNLVNRLINLFNTTMMPTGEEDNGLMPADFTTPWPQLTFSDVCPDDHPELKSATSSLGLSVTVSGNTAVVNVHSTGSQGRLRNAFNQNYASQLQSSTITATCGEKCSDDDFMDYIDG